MVQPGPPPPPPPPGFRGPIPQAGGPQSRGPPPPGGPGGQFRPPGPPGGGPPPMQLPIRQNSSRIVDVTPPKMLDETTCLKKLTTYSGFTIRKAPPNDPKRDKPTWARSEVIDEKLSQEDIIKQIKKLNERGKPVAEKKAALAPHQGTQITRLLDDLISSEPDRNFEWTLAQLDRKEKIHKHGLRETLTMTVFFKRSPLKDLNPVVLHQNIERNRHERLMAQNRPPQPQQQQQQQQQQQPQQQRPPQQGGGPPPQGSHPIFKIERKESRSRLPMPRRDGGRPGNKYHSDSESSDSQYDSESASDSDYGSSQDTSVSSRSRGDRRYKGKNRPRSYSRHREHRKSYYVDNRAFSPEQRGLRDQHRFSVPDVPRTIPGAVPGFNPVAAAYQAGKIDADTERYGMERERELERLERERFAPPARPIIIEPRAVVSYGRPEPRRYEPMRHYSDAGGRYFDDKYADDLRSHRDEEYILRRERAVEDYIDRRRPSDLLERRRSDSIDRRGDGPRIVFRDNPFSPVNLPRRYPPSADSYGI